MRFALTPEQSEIARPYFDAKAREDFTLVAQIKRATDGFEVVGVAIRYTTAAKIKALIEKEGTVVIQP